MDTHFCAKQQIPIVLCTDIYLQTLICSPYFGSQCYVKFIMCKLNFFSSLFSPMNCTRLVSYLYPLFPHIHDPLMFLYIPQSVSLEMLRLLIILSRITDARRNNGPWPRLLLYSLFFNPLQIPSLNTFVLCIQQQMSMK